MESVKITVIVHSGRGLVSKRHPVCQASVVFGIGKDLYATEVIESNEPTWKQEAVFELNKPEKESIKFKVKDKDHTIGTVKVPIKTLTTTPLLQWFPIEHHKKGGEVNGEILIQLSSNTPLTESATDDKEGNIPSAKLSSSSTEDSSWIMSNLKDYFKRPAAPGHRRHSSRDEGLKKSEMNHYSSDSQLHESTSPRKSDLVTTYTPVLSKRSSLSPENNTRSHAPWRPRSPLVASGPDAIGRLSPASVVSEASSDIPEVTGISPKEASTDGGDKVILRGTNLGTSLEDIVQVLLVNIDCTEYVEYVSSGEHLVNIVVCYAVMCTCKLESRISWNILKYPEIFNTILTKSVCAC
jgi:hypothetical protein